MGLSTNEIWGICEKLDYMYVFYANLCNNYDVLGERFCNFMGEHDRKLTSVQYSNGAAGSHYVLEHFTR